MSDPLRADALFCPCNGERPRSPAQRPARTGVDARRYIAELGRVSRPAAGRRRYGTPKALWRIYSKVWASRQKSQ